MYFWDSKEDCIGCLLSDVAYTMFKKGAFWSEKYMQTGNFISGPLWSLKNAKNECKLNDQSTLPDHHLRSDIALDQETV